MSDERRSRGTLMAVLVAGLGVGFLLAWLLLLDPLGLFQKTGESGEKHDHGQQEAGQPGQLWTCGMHPQVIQNEPGQCPICHMDLVPLDTGEGDHEGPGGQGGATVRIDPTVIQTMNVRTEVVERRSLSRRVRTVGYLEYDQERMVTVTPKYSGWVEQVFVNYVGETVQKGAPLFEIYSPELVQTEEELLSALRFAERMKDAPPATRQRSEALVAAARTRLGYWDVSPEQIRQLEQTGHVFRTLTVAAPAGGLVMKRLDGLEGMAVKPGMELFHIANLATLWLTVEVFEDQIAWIRPGLEAEVTFPYFPGETFTGRVQILDPALSEETRTLGVKLALPNRGGALKAGMFATVVFRADSVRDAVAVPAQAVLRTGERNVAIVAVGDLSEGRFAPRVLELGFEGEGYLQVLSGLEAGERVVTSAQFLIDSEASLREAIRGMVGDGG